MSDLDRASDAGPASDAGGTADPASGSGPAGGSGRGRGEDAPASSPSGRFDVEGQVVVLTGGAGFLGGEYTRALSAAGAHVVVADVDAGAARETADSAPGARALAVEADVTSPDAVDALARRASQEFGGVDTLVNNAALDPKFDPEHAGEREEGFEEFPLAAWKRSLEVDLTGAFLATRALAPALLESGRGVVVNVASIYGVVGPDQRLYQEGHKPVAYSVTKAGLLGFTRWLATYYAGRPLRANALVLGGVEHGHQQGFRERYAYRTPAGRMARPPEAADALRFLISEASSYMTGSSLVVDGGWTAW